MKGRDDFVVLGKIGQNRGKSKERQGCLERDRTARDNVVQRHSVNFLSGRKVCLRQCCRVKRQIQMQQSQQKLKKVKMGKLMMQQRSIDGLNQGRQSTIKKQSFANSRLKTIHHETRKINKAKVYFLPHLKEFTYDDLLDNEVDHEAQHKVRQGSRNSGFLLTQDKEVVSKARPVPVVLKQNRVKTQDSTTQVNFQEKRANNTLIQRHEIHKFIENSRKRQKSQDERTTQTRPYYKYLQNYPKKNDKYQTPQKRHPQLLQEDDVIDEQTKKRIKRNSQKEESGAQLQNTIFHHNKLRMSLLTSNSKIVQSQIMELPKSEEQVSALLLKYKPLQPQFNVRMLVKKQSFEIIRDQNFVYCGEIKNGKRHGKGILLTKKQLFQGLFMNDYKSSGAQKTKIGTYIGPFLKGKRHGIGQFKWQDGQFFQGEWKQGKKDGHGVWRSSKGNLYEGQWKNNKQNGKGVYVHIGGSKYTGYFRDFLKHGRGEQQFANGDKYSGQYNQGKPHGYGTYIWSNGDIYKGDFQEGSRSGQGTLFFSNGIIYEGGFQNDKLNGAGKQKYPNGDYFEGQFKQGEKLQGKKYNKLSEEIGVVGGA